MTPIDSIGNTAAINFPPEIGEENAVDGDFKDFLKDALGQVQEAQVASDRAMEKLAVGDARSIHEVMVAMEEADISMRMVVQIRNKLVDAYKEMMQMQV